MGGTSVGAMAVVLAIAPFVFLNANFDPANLPQSAWVQVWGLAFAAWALARSPRLGASLVDLPLALLVAWGVLSVAWATSRGEAIPVAVHWVGCAAWFVAVSRTVARPEEARLLALALFASGAAVAALGLAQYLFGVAAIYQAIPPAATFVNKNIAAQYVVATLPLGLAALVEWPRLRVTARGVVCALAAVAMAVFLVVTVTRSAWLAAWAEILAVVTITAGARRLRLSRSMAAAVVIVIGLVTVLSGMAGRLRAVLLPAPAAHGETAPMYYTSIQHRQAIWLNTGAMIADAPVLGVGLGNHKVHYPPYARRIAFDERMSARTQLDHVHNDPLQLAAETGLVGAALCTWLLWTSVATWRRAAPALPRSLTVAWAAAAIGIATDALFSFPMQRALPPVVLAVGLGSLAGLLVPRPGPGRIAARALAAAGAAALIGVASYQARAIRADGRLPRMLAAEARGSWNEVRDVASTVLADRPDDRRALFSLATAELARRRFPEAQAALGRVLEEYPHDLPALGNLALATAAGGDDVAALRSWDRVLALDPRDHRAHFGKAEILDRMGATGAALRSFRLATELAEPDARYQLRLGSAAARAGFHEEAAAAFGVALKLAPGNAAAHEGLGNALIALGWTDEGHEHLARARVRRGG